MISIQDLTIGYKNTAISAPITGEIKLGSLTAVIGPNGTGKSTFLKTICGIIPLISGDIHCSLDLKKNIAWLPQNAHIDHDFPINVYEVVAMGCWPRKNFIQRITSNDKQRIFAALEQVGITDLAKVSINSLSGGQFQRMLFARLLVQDLPIMLMDEPFTGIDEETQNLLLSLILKLNKEGKTIVTVLHDISVVENYFPNLIRLDENKVSFH